MSPVHSRSFEPTTAGVILGDPVAPDAQRDSSVPSKAPAASGIPSEPAEPAGASSGTSKNHRYISVFIGMLLITVVLNW